MYLENQNFHQYEKLKQSLTKEFNIIYKHAATMETTASDLHIFYITTKYETAKLVYNSTQKTINMKNIHAYELHEINLLQSELREEETK